MGMAIVVGAVFGLLLFEIMLRQRQGKDHADRISGLEAHALVQEERWLQQQNAERAGRSSAFVVMRAPRDRPD